MAESVASPTGRRRRPPAACELCGVTRPRFELAPHPTRDYRGAPMVVLICRDAELCIAAADRAGRFARGSK